MCIHGSFEDALLSNEPHTVMTQILTRFVLNLRPGTRNIRSVLPTRLPVPTNKEQGFTLFCSNSTDQISSTLSGVLAEYSKSSERTVFWDDDLGVNVDPFKGLNGGFFAADWDTKVRHLIALFLGWILDRIILWL